MPKAVVNDEYQRYDLETLPEGYVMLREMAFGDKLERDGMSLEMSSSMKQGAKDTRLDLALGNRKVTLFEFQKCVGEHNLEDNNGQLLDLTSAQGIGKLAPKIGTEIDDLIKKLNNFDAEGN